MKLEDMARPSEERSDKQESPLTLLLARPSRLAQVAKEAEKKIVSETPAVAERKMLELEISKGRDLSPGVYVKELWNPQPQRRSMCYCEDPTCPFSYSSREEELRMNDGRYAREAFSRSSPFKSWSRSPFDRSSDPDDLYDPYYDARGR